MRLPGLMEGDQTRKDFHKEEKLLYRERMHRQGNDIYC